MDRDLSDVRAFGFGVKTHLSVVCLTRYARGKRVVMVVAGLLVIVLVAFGLSRLVGRREGVEEHCPSDNPIHQPYTYDVPNSGAGSNCVWHGGPNNARSGDAGGWYCCAQE